MKLVLRAVVAAFLIACGCAALAETAPDVVITFEGELEEFPRYHTDGRYLVEIPDRHRSKLIRGAVSTASNANGASIWAFPQQPGTQAQLVHKPGRIEITFAADPGGAAIEASSSHAAAAAPLVFAQSTAPEPLAPVAENTRTITGSSLADQSIALADFALDVPDSPAFAVLGLTPATAVRPSNPQEFIASVLNGLDQNGNFQTSLALDTAPYPLLFGKEITLEKYQRSYATRLLTRTQLSFATSKGVEDEDNATRLALGLHLTLLDRGDPRFDIDLQRTYDAIDEEVRRMRGPIPPGEGMAEQAARDEAAMRPLFRAAFEEARRRNWNRTNWSLGAAPSWISPGSDTGDFRWNGGTVWSSFAYGFEGVAALEKTSQLILHARYRNGEEAPDSLREGAFIRQNSVLAGARLRIGTADTNCSFDGAWIRETPRGREAATGYRFSFGLERRMTSNLWLSLSLGKEFNGEDRDEPLLILATFKLGSGEKASARAAAAPVVFRREVAEIEPSLRSRRAADKSLREAEMEQSAIRETDTKPEPARPATRADFPVKTSRPVLDRPIKKLGPAVDEEERESNLPAKTARPHLDRAIRKLPAE